MYGEVYNRGQPTIALRWVITTKYVDGNKSYKECIVARGFEESTDHHRKVSPACKHDIMQILAMVVASKGWLLKSIDIIAAFFKVMVTKEMYL